MYDMCTRLNHCYRSLGAEVDSWVTGAGDVSFGPLHVVVGVLWGHDEYSVRDTQVFTPNPFPEKKTHKKTLNFVLVG